MSHPCLSFNSMKNINIDFVWHCASTSTCLHLFLVEARNVFKWQINLGKILSSYCGEVNSLIEFRSALAYLLQEKC